MKELFPCPNCNSDKLKMFYCIKDSKLYTYIECDVCSKKGGYVYFNEYQTKLIWNALCKRMKTAKEIDGICPFCGDTNLKLVSEEDGTKWIECIMCSKSIHYTDNLKKAMEYWKEYKYSIEIKVNKNTANVIKKIDLRYKDEVKALKSNYAELSKQFDVNVKEYDILEDINKDNNRVIKTLLDIIDKSKKAFNND